MVGCGWKKQKGKETSRMIPGILALETTHVVMPCSAVDKDAGPGMGHKSVFSKCERLISYPDGVLRGI